MRTSGYNNYNPKIYEPLATPTCTVKAMEPREKALLLQGAKQEKKALSVGTVPMP